MEVKQNKGYPKDSVHQTRFVLFDLLQENFRHLQNDQIDDGAIQFVLNLLEQKVKVNR